MLGRAALKWSPWSIWIGLVTTRLTLILRRTTLENWLKPALSVGAGRVTCDKNRYDEVACTLTKAHCL